MGIAETDVVVIGECPYWRGCVPSKMMIRAANLLAEARRVPDLAGGSTVAPRWEPVARRIREGGGAVGAELAQVFARFGARVAVVEALPRLLPAEEPEAGDLLAGVFAREQIAVRAGTRAEGVSHDGCQFRLSLPGGEVLTGQRLLVATGRRADLAALGAGAYGLDEAAPAIKTDERMRAAQGLWAVGNVTGKGAFTHVSMYQAGIAARDNLGAGGPSASYRAVPRATFTDPEIGSVGLTEAGAGARGLAVRAAATPLAASARGWIHKAGNDGFVKLVEDPGRGVLVGATSAAPSAAPPSASSSPTPWPAPFSKLGVFQQLLQPPGWQRGRSTSGKICPPRPMCGRSPAAARRFPR